MKKIIFAHKNMSRSYMANPFLGKSLHSRLIKNQAIDLLDNSTLHDLGNGYSLIKPIDTNMLFK
jgi:hypothetical protein